MMEWFSKNRHPVSAIVFFILSAALRFLAEIRTIHPTGWDGYYYVMQVHSWITFGHMQAPDFSLIYPFFTLFTFVAPDPVTGFKIGVAVLAGLLVISVYFYLIQRSVSWTIVCLACSYVVFSPLITYFILQFPKNTLGLTFFIFLIGRLQTGKINVRDGIITTILFFATVITHRMTGVFALLAIILFAFRYISWKWLVPGAVVVIALGFLPGVLHVSDFARLNGQFTTTPHWSPLYFAIVFGDSLDWIFTGDLVLITIAAIIVVILVIIDIRHLSSQALIWAVILSISLFPFFEFTGGAAGYRFFMITPIALIVLIAELLKLSRVINLVFAGSFIVLALFSYRSYKPAFDAPNEAYIPIVNRLVERYDPHAYPLVIAHKSLAEIIIFKTDFDALNWLPPTIYFLSTCCASYTA